ncbi:hypothetical protein VTO73DRAFT_3872 [Trametes versicolor]
MAANFSTSAYMQFQELDGGHSDTVNCLVFSPTGAALASGGDDCALIIWNVAQGRLLYRLLFKSALDSVLWHPTQPDTVIVGCANGMLQQIQDFSLMRSEAYDINVGARSTVHCLDYDTNTGRLAIGMGEEVHVTRERTPNCYSGNVVFPPPPEPERLSDKADQRLRAVALKFHDDGKSLIVSYLAHGIRCWDSDTRESLWNIPMPSATPNIGGAAVSPDHRYIVVYNTVNGLDLYAVGVQKKPMAKMSYKLDKAPRTKHSLQVSFIHKGHGIVCGTTSGKIRVWETRSGEPCQDLDHGENDIIQAVATTLHSKTSYIATGSTARGQGTYIKIWRAKIAEQGGSVDFGESVVDLVQSVARSNLAQPGKIVLETLAMLLAMGIFLGSLWVCFQVPWTVVGHGVVGALHFVWDLTSHSVRAGAAWVHDRSVEILALLWSGVSYLKEFFRDILRSFVLSLLPELTDGVAQNVGGPGLREL